MKRTSALIGMAGCFIAVSAGSSAQQAAALRVGTTTSDAAKSLYYAKKAGIFQKYGVDVEITQINSGAAGMAAVAGGSLDVVTSSLLAVAQAHLRGIPFQIVAPSNLYSSEHPATVLVMRKGAPIRRGSDLQGKTIGSASLRDLNTAAAFAWIDQTGGDHRLVHVVELPQSDVLAALDTGRIDAAVLATPYLEAAFASGKVVLLAKALDAIGPRFEVSGFAVHADAVAKNPDPFARFARAIHESIVFTNAHLDQTVALVADYSGVDAAVIAKSIRIVDPEYVEARYIQPVIDAAVKAGLIDRRFDASEIISTAALRPH